MPFNENSAAMNISSLDRGEVFTRSTLIPMTRANARQIAKERHRLVKLLSPVVARVEKQTRRKYSMHTTTAFTRSYDVIVSASVLCGIRHDKPEEDNEEL